MTDRWTNYTKCLNFLRFSNTCTHTSSFTLMSSLKRQTLLGPVYSHFFLTKTIKALLQKTYLALAAFSQNRIFLGPQTQNSSNDHTSADKMATPVVVWLPVSPVPYTITHSHLYFNTSESSFVSQSQTPRVTNLRLSPARSSVSIM